MATINSFLFFYLYTQYAMAKRMNGQRIWLNSKERKWRGKINLIHDAVKMLYFDFNYYFKSMWSQSGWLIYSPNHENTSFLYFRVLEIHFQPSRLRCSNRRLLQVQSFYILSTNLHHTHSHRHIFTWKLFQIISH